MTSPRLVPAALRVVTQWLKQLGYHVLPPPPPVSKNGTCSIFSLKALQTSAKTAEDNNIHCQHSENGGLRNICSN
jgi:hypothetical protein